MTGIWGTRVANETMREADVILAIGTAFGEADCSSWRPEHTFAIPPTRLIQIDIDPQEIGKIYPVDVGIVGDAKTVLRQLVEALRGWTPDADDRSASRRDTRCAPIAAGMRSSSRASATMACRFIRRVCSTRSRRLRRAMRST